MRYEYDGMVCNNRRTVALDDKGKGVKAGCSPSSGNSWHLVPYASYPNTHALPPPDPLNTRHHLVLPAISYLVPPGSADVSKDSEVRPQEEEEAEEEDAMPG